MKHLNPLWPYRHGECMPEDLTTKNFDEFLTKHDKVVVDFWAPWCGPCHMITPIIKSLADEMDNIAFAKVNVDDNQEIAQNYSIMSIPTLIFFKNGKMADMSVGVMAKEELENKIKTIF